MQDLQRVGNRVPQIEGEKEIKIFIVMVILSISFIITDHFIYPLNNGAI